MAKPTYQQLYALSAHGDLHDRCTIAIEKYGQFIADESADTAFHHSRFNWAMGAQSNPRGVAAPLLVRIAFDPIFSNQDPWTDPATGLAAVTDAQLQSAVETAVNRTA